MNDPLRDLKDLHYHKNIAKILKTLEKWNDLKPDYKELQELSMAFTDIVMHTEKLKQQLKER